MARSTLFVGDVSFCRHGFRAEAYMKRYAGFATNVILGLLVIAVASVSLNCAP